MVVGGMAVAKALEGQRLGCGRRGSIWWHGCGKCGGAVGLGRSGSLYSMSDSLSHSHQVYQTIIPVNATKVKNIIIV